MESLSTSQLLVIADVSPFIVFGCYGAFFILIFVGYQLASFVAIVFEAIFVVLCRIANGHTRLETFLAQPFVRYGVASPIFATFLISMSMLFSSTFLMFALATSMIDSDMFTIRQGYALSMIPSALFLIRSFDIAKPPYGLHGGFILVMLQLFKCTMIMGFFTMPSDTYKDFCIGVQVPTVFDIVFLVLEMIVKASPKMVTKAYKKK